MAQTWQDILNTFKSQFQLSSPDKYQDIDNPELRTQLANERATKALQGADIATGVIATNVDEARKAAESAANAKKSASNYKRAYNKEGGYDYYDPTGKKISAWQYAIAKGEPISNALQGSMKQEDINFLQDVNAALQDVSSGNYDFQTGLSYLARDYPQIFGIQVNPNSKAGQEFAKTPGFSETRRDFALSRIGEQLAPQLSGQDKRTQSAINGAVMAISQATSRDQAQKLLDEFKMSNSVEAKSYRKIDDDTKETVDSTLDSILDQTFPVKSNPTSIYPF